MLIQLLNATCKKGSVSHCFLNVIEKMLLWPYLLPSGSALPLGSLLTTKGALPHRVSAIARE